MQDMPIENQKSKIKNAGFAKCETLKKIRQMIADKNGIEYHTTDCNFQGRCSGTCPKCEAELRYLESELQKRKSAGRKVAVAGLALGLSMLASQGASAQTDNSRDDYEPASYGVSANQQSLCTGADELEGDPAPLDNIDVKQLEGELEGEEMQVFFIAEEMPEFPGGQSAMLKFIAENIRLPELPGELPSRTTVYIRVVINENGKVILPELIRGCDPVLDAEAFRVVGMMPDWKPGRQRGRAVKVYMHIPLKFDFQY